MVKGEMLIKLGGQFINSIEMHANTFQWLLRPFRARIGSRPFLGLGKVAICANVGADHVNGLTPDFTTFLRPKTGATQW